MNYNTHPKKHLHITGDKLRNLVMLIRRWEEPDKDHGLKTGLVGLRRDSTSPTAGDANSPG